MIRITNVSSALQGEALGFLSAMQQVWIRGWRKVWFEGDCMELDRVVNNVVLHHVLFGNVLHDIRHWMSFLPNCSLGSVNHERNQAADALSRYIFDVDVDALSFSVPPLWY